MSLPRLQYDMVSPVMFLRPRRPEDHREFEALLPQCEPLFIYADLEGDQWVRWAIPKQVAADFGLGEMRCACCGAHEGAESEHSFLIDTALTEVGWFLDREGVNRG